MGQIYVCDADALINLHRYFRKESLRALRKLLQKGGLKLPEGICRELQRGTDELAKFAKDAEKAGAVVRMAQNPSLRDTVAEMERKYGKQIIFGRATYKGFWSSKAGRKAADAQVVATARFLEAICVSDDKAVQMACALENIPCIGWIEFARQLGMARQLSLL